MTLIFPVADRADLLRPFMAYYAKLGITRFVCGLYNGRANALYSTVRALVEVRPSCICPWEQFNGPAEVDGLNEIRAEFVGLKDWYAIADLDEFMAGHQSLPELADAAQAGGYAAVHGKFVDRIAPNGCPAIDNSRSLDEQFPLRADVAHGIAVSDKICLARGDVPIASGHHRVAPEFQVLWHALEVHHFKWTSGVEERLQERARLFTAQGLPWAGESAAFLKRIQSGLTAGAVLAAPIGA